MSTRHSQKRNCSQVTRFPEVAWALLGKGRFLSVLSFAQCLPRLSFGARCQLDCNWRTVFNQSPELFSCNLIYFNLKMSLGKTFCHHGILKHALNRKLFSFLFFFFQNTSPGYVLGTYPLHSPFLKGPHQLWVRCPGSTSQMGTRLEC